MAISVKAGDLRNRVAIERKTTAVSNAFGERTNGWETLANVWAEITPVSARELERAKSFGENISHIAKVRYSGEITVDMRLNHRDRYLMINGIINEDERRIRQQLFCTELPPNGQ